MEFSRLKKREGCKYDGGHGYNSNAACHAVSAGGEKLCLVVDMGPRATRLKATFKSGIFQEHGLGLQQLPLESPTMGTELSQPKPLVNTSLLLPATF